jgi:hypothetical protein
VRLARGAGPEVGDIKTMTRNPDGAISRAGRTKALAQRPGEA